MISIIIPLYNKENGIERCVTSVLSQTYTNWELLIIDDGSTDGSFKRIESFLCDKRIRYIYKNNGGVSSARNKGILEAKGEWITYIDADDYFLPCALEVLYETAMKNKTKISTANHYVEKKGTKKLCCLKKKEGVIKNNFKQYFFRDISLRAGAALYHSSILKKELFDEKLSRYEDLKAILEIMRSFKISYSPMSVMCYTLDQTGLSHKCKDINKDFLFSLNFNHKSFWEKMILANLLRKQSLNYREHRRLLYDLYSQIWHFLYIVKFLDIICRIRVKCYGQ